MKIYFLKSACVLVETKGLRILMDPWLTDSEFCGAWYHYPPFKFKKSFFDNIDYIYLSHIHPDHFSRETFNRLDKNIPVLIHQYENDFLAKNVQHLGFQVFELPHNERTLLKNQVHINILAADNCNPEICAKYIGCPQVETRYGSTQIDSLCVLDDGEYTLLNINDCHYDLAKDAVKNLLDEYQKVDFLLVGYASAGPYPQCFEMTDSEKIKADTFIKNHMLMSGLSYIKKVSPDYYMPFAGSYVLGGKLAELNSKKAVPELEEAKSYFEDKISESKLPSKCVLLNTYEHFDLSKKSSSQEYKSVDKNSRIKYIQEKLSTKKFPYELDKIPDENSLISLIPKSYLRLENKRKEIKFNSEISIVIEFDSNKCIIIPLNGEGFRIIDRNEIQQTSKHLIITLDPRLLFRLLQGPSVIHWSEASMGSHIRFSKHNFDGYPRGLFHCLYFFYM